jgi:hypothetical protein
MSKRRNARHWDAPQLHADHPRPVTRRQFVAQGFMSGAAYTVGGGALSLLSQNAMGALSGDIDYMRLNICKITDGVGKIPFICFDLSGGANIAGSNVLVGQSGGQSDFLSTAGYEKMGLPGDMVPGLTDVNGNPFANFDLGLGFHFDSAFRRGIMASLTQGTELNVNGAVIPARSDNDTGNNPHNPMYGIALAGAKGSILTLAGSENTDSGGNSTLPAMLYNSELRPTKVDRPTDVVNLVNTGDLVGILSKPDATAVMESIYRLSDSKMDAINTQVAADAAIKQAVNCGYVKAAHIAEEFGGVPIDPLLDDNIVADDNSAIFTTAELTDGSRNAREFQKTASVMKLVMNGFAGAGCIEMGGYDYHGGGRAEGEVKDFRAGRCMGAVLEYAARLKKPVMMYVFSDGSLSSNGALDNSTEGRGKGMWTSDNSSTAASFFLVYNPNGRPQLLGGPPDQQALHQQIGAMDAGGSVMVAGTPAANNVNLLVNTVILNYMALHGEQGGFGNLLLDSNGNPWNHGLGTSSDQLDALTAFAPIVSGDITNPV